MCSIQFQDVPQTDTFYPFVTCLACRNILSGYTCGGEGEPCGNSGNPYFRPGVSVTRGQIAKIAAGAAGIKDAAGAQVYEDVLPSSPFYTWINQLSNKGYMGGYTCGGAGESCVQPGNRPYFRPGASATRGQITKIVSNAAMFNESVSGQTYQDVAPDSPFYTWIERLSSRNVMGGYSCGGAGEPCVQPGGKPYFRPNNPVTRGQAAKIVSNTFFPNCQDRAGNAVDALIQNFHYVPEQITVAVGATVRWTNYDLDYHTVTSAPGDPLVLDSTHIQQGESFTYTFTTPGTYNYICVPHPYMTGRIVVTP